MQAATMSLTLGLGVLLTAVTPAPLELAGPALPACVIMAPAAATCCGGDHCGCCLAAPANPRPQSEPTALTRTSHSQPAIVLGSFHTFHAAVTAQPSSRYATPLITDTGPPAYVRTHAFLI